MAGRMGKNYGGGRRTPVFPCRTVEAGLKDGGGVHSSRREFLKKSAAAGAAAWSAPAILSLPAGRAWAQQYGGCPCSASAFGLRVVIPAGSVDETFGVGGCVAMVAEGAPGTATVAASAVCSSADSDGSDDLCAAEASVGGLNVVVGDPLAPDLVVVASVLASSARASCEECGTAGGSSIASLIVDGEDVDVTLCDFSVGGFVVVNEQTCGGDGTLSVNALHITVPGVVEVIVAHSEAGAQSCPCAACA